MAKRDETVEITCPKCARRLKLRAAEAEERMSVRCACGETIPLVKAF